MQLYLIRHPPPAVSPGLCYGSTDIPLVGDPAAAAARVRSILPTEAQCGPVLTSPLRRCRALAGCLTAQPTIDPRLREVDFGDWELRRWDDIGAAAVGRWAADPIGFTPPGGEPLRAALARALACIGELAATETSAACVVTHGGIIRLLAGHWRQSPETDWAGLHVGFGRVSGFALDGEMRARTLFVDA